MPPISVLLSLFLLLPFPTPGDTLTTNFTYSGRLLCLSNRPYSFVVEILEEDITEASDDIIARSRYQGVKTMTKYHVFGQDSHDGLFNFYYEIVLLIHHDCIKDPCFPEGTVKTIRVPMGNYSIVHGGYRKVINFEITDKGNVSKWPQLD